MKTDLYFLNRGTSLVVDATKENGGYILEFNGVPNIKRGESLAIREGGKQIELKIINIQQITNKSQTGPAVRMRAVALIAKQQEVKVTVDAFKDQDFYRLKFNGPISFQNEDGEIVYLDADPFEIKAKQIKGAK